jgi:hypothetical protein
LSSMQEALGLIPTIFVLKFLTSFLKKILYILFIFQIPCGRQRGGKFIFHFETKSQMTNLIKEVCLGFVTGSLFVA